MDEHYNTTGLAGRDARILRALGDTIRARRRAARLTRRALADKSGLSERFLGDLEVGKGNISVLRLQQVAGALNTRASDLLASAEGLELHAQPGREPGIVTLVGLRGAGKSTIGRMAAQRLGVEFYELDEWIAKEAGMDLPTIFEIHGEAYFRKMELRALRKLLVDSVTKPRASAGGSVIAAGGSIVTSKEAYELVLSKTNVVWLAARPQDHWDRVVAQGDVRPMRNRANAMAELKALLRQRRPLYAKAHVIVQTSGVPTMEVVDRVVSAAYEGKANERAS
jgi:XRE family aerobic/anaerobic benzoate catabolism transcriptional regulator